MLVSKKEKVFHVTKMHEEGLNESGRGTIHQQSNPSIKGLKTVRVFQQSNKRGMNSTHKQMTGHKSVCN